MKSYEELTGSTGTRIRYEAEKFSPKELFRQFPPRVVVAGHALPLAQFSLTSVTVLISSAIDFDLVEGDEPMVDFRIADRRFFYGGGRVIDVDRSSMARKVEILLSDGYLNLSEMIEYHESLVFDRELLIGLEEAEVGVQPAYKQILTDTLFLLRRFATALDRFEAKLKGQGTLTAARAADMLMRCEESIRPDWRSVRDRAHDLVCQIRDDAQAMFVHKRMTELILTPELTRASIWKRAYEKPLGYPGDAGLMRMIYAWGREGDSLYEQLLFYLGLDCLECVATRMTLVQQAIARLLIERSESREPVRITNLGAGTAQEVRNIVSDARLAAPVKFTLVDQDRETLAETYSTLYPDVLRHRQRVVVDGLHVSFVELMRAGDLFRKLPPQDMIYSLGLFDYLGQKRAVALIESLYDQLAEGGTLVIGNLRDCPESGYWQSEFIADWSMIHRTETEMKELATGLQGARVSLQLEPRDAVWLLTIRKP